MELTSANAAHIPAIRYILAETWPVTYGNILSAAQIDYMIGLMYRPDALSRQIESGHRFLLLEDGAAPIGFAGYEHNYSPGVTKLHKLYVLPGHHRKGGGTLLLNAVLQAAASAGQQALILNVNRHNPAVHFYTRQGFHVARAEDVDIGSGYFMNDFIMERALKQGLKP